ncbi:hypothetical protein JB92DRAFT_91970 [Gautieria morchelliformis]|nr:hypothetical protein JB92DRAFT_91970 [Gautieria morchelliformis]
MTRWLTRQGKLHSFGTFLLSVSPGEADMNEEYREEYLGRLVRCIPASYAAPRSQKVDQRIQWAEHTTSPKVPAFRTPAVSSTINKFGPTEFIPALTAFLRFYLPRCTLHLSISTRLHVCKVD